MPLSPDRSNEVPLEAKVAFLRRPETWNAGPVEVRDTHMSCVVLVGDRVYKLKKPVRFEFLDFSSLARRRRACLDEVRLNRRLAPRVYVGAVPLTVDASGALQVDGAGRVVDWLVVMRRLRDEDLLDVALRSGTADRVRLRVVLGRLGRFWSHAPRHPVRRHLYRRRQQLRAAADLAELERWGFAVADLREGLREVVARRPDLLDGRADRVVEGHGDLRPEHVCLAPPVVIDCLEFDRRLRLLDPVEELAFLGMECERIGASWVGELALQVYGTWTGDHPDPTLVHLYAARRACLRAKLQIWHLRDPVPDPERWRRRARVYLDLARRHASAAALTDRRVR